MNNASLTMVTTQDNLSKTIRLTQTKCLSYQMQARWEVD